MNLQQTFMDYYTSETLASFVKLCAAVVPSGGTLTRKEQRAKYLTDSLLHPQYLRQLWIALDDLSRKAIAVAYHNGGEFVEDAFIAQYGDLPARPQQSVWYFTNAPILLDLFIHRGQIPPDLLTRLAELVPPPERFQVVGTEEIDTIKGGDVTLAKLRVAQTEESGWHDLLLFLQLYDQGEVKLTTTGTKLTPGSVPTLSNQLLNGDFLQPADLEKTPRRRIGATGELEIVENKAKQEDAIRPNGLMNFAIGARLVTTYRRGGLTELGRAYLMRQEPELLLEVFEKWMKESTFDEITRIEVIKGLRARGVRLTKPSLRRERIVEALSWCPVNVWIRIADFYRALKIWYFDFEIEEGGIEKLYVGYRHGSGYYEAWGSEQDMWLLTNGQYINAVLWEYLAVIGALDIAYLPPREVMLDVSPYLDFDDEYFSRYDGLLYFRINPLGAYLFGQAGDYRPLTASGAPLLRIDADCVLTLVDPAQVSPVIRSQLEKIATAEGKDSYRLERQKVLLMLEEGANLDEWREFLTLHSGAPLPLEVEAWLDQVTEASGAFVVDGRMLRIRAASQELIQLVLADGELGKLCKTLGNRDLVIPASSETRFRNLLRQLGYGLR